MYTHCNACKIEICAEDIVVACEGLCDDHRYFHAKCVGLTYDEGCACLHSNIFWMCDCCRDIIERGRFQNAMKKIDDAAYAKQKEVDCLKSEVKRISEMVVQMTSNSSSEPSLSTLHRPESSHRFIPESSPLSSTKIDSIDPASDVQNDENVQLYVSNIAIDVPENEVKLMVCETIRANNVQSMKCLVPAWKDTSNISYVSYKVTIDARFRDAALNSANWPVGVRCREFRNLSQKPWRPSSREIQETT